MPPLSNTQHEQLCQEYVKTPNDPRRAAIAAGYKDGPKLLETVARILAYPLIAARITELRLKAANEGSVSSSPHTRWTEE